MHQPRPVVIRDATPADLDAIFRIYNDEVLHGTATFDTEPFSDERAQTWLAHHPPDRHPAIVAVDDHDEVLAWASLSPWSDRCAYARAAEVSVYVDASARARGLGRLLVTTLSERAPGVGIFVLLARITSESVASQGLFTSLGFELIGTMRRVGEKHGRILDVKLYDRHLDAAA